MLRYYNVLFDGITTNQKHCSPTDISKFLFEHECDAFSYDYLKSILSFISLESSSFSFRERQFCVSGFSKQSLENDLPDELRMEIDRFKSVPHKEFLYMVQTDLTSKVPITPNLSRDVAILNFKHDETESIYLPKSMWCEGRNKLREFALSLPHKYQFYVLMDDDVNFESGSFEAAEKEVSANCYDIYNPRLNECLYDSRNRNVKHSVFATYYFDPILNYFSDNVFRDEKIFPYDCSLDATSWWYSGGTFISKCAKFYKGKVVVSNNCRVINLEHREYPKKMHCSFHDFVGINPQKDEPQLDECSDLLNVQFKNPKSFQD